MFSDSSIGTWFVVLFCAALVLGVIFEDRLWPPEHYPTKCAWVQQLNRTVCEGE